jgi:hypothetical protein
MVSQLGAEFDPVGIAFRSPESPVCATDGSGTAAACAEIHTSLRLACLFRPQVQPRPSFSACRLSSPSVSRHSSQQNPSASSFTSTHTSPPAPPAPWLRWWFVRWLLLLPPPPFRRRRRLRRSRPQEMRAGCVGWLATEVGSGRNLLRGHTAFDPAPHRMLINHSPRISQSQRLRGDSPAEEPPTKPRLPTIIEAQVKNVRHSGPFSKKKALYARQYIPRPAAAPIVCVDAPGR